MRGRAALDRAAVAWDAVPWRREEAERAFLLARADTRGADVFGAVAGGSGLAALVEQRRLPTAVGYRVVYAPRLRVLQLVDGGIAAQDDAAAAALAGAVERALADGVADVATVPYLPLASAELAALERVGTRLERSRSPVGARRRLVLPATFDEFLASRRRKIRFGIRYDAKKLLEAHGDDLSVAVLSSPDDLDRLVADLEAVAATAYQRALGAGFADTEEQRAVARVGLERGWARAWVLYHRATPIAYWLCSLYRRTLLLRRTGFTPSYAPLRVGIYLLMRVIEDACADGEIDVVDFGQGDASYKRHFSNECYDEAALTIFAPTFRGRRTRIVRGTITGGVAVARRALDRAELTDRIRSTWRRRL